MASDPDPITLLRLRLQRAEKHLKELDGEAERVNADLYTNRIRKELDPKESIYRWRIEVTTLPTPELGLIIVDCVNHLRSFFDNLWWYLALRYGNAKLRGAVTKFPICITEGSWNDLKPVLSEFPSQVVEMIDANQPYHALKYGATPREHMMWVLNRRWNDDKHRTVEALRYIVRDAKFGPPRLERYFTDTAFAPRADDGAVIGTVQCSESLSPQDETDLYGNFLLDIGFGPRAMDAYPVQFTLHRFHEQISNMTFPWFKPYLR